MPRKSKALSVYDLYVVVFPHTDGYSYDTAIPDEIFLREADAEAKAAELNEQLQKMMMLSKTHREKKYYVSKLYDRLDEIQRQSYFSGQDSERRGSVDW